MRLRAGAEYETIYMDAKSDFVLSPLPNAAISQLFASIMSWPAGNVAALCDAYGGAISTLAAQRHGVCPPLARGLFDPVLFALDQRGGFGDAGGAAETGV